MTRWTLPQDNPAEARNAAVVASVITTFLSPIFFYVAATAAIGYPGIGAALGGAVLGVYVMPFFPFVAPLQFAFLFLCSLAMGIVLPLCRAGHIAFFTVAGAALAIAAWALMPTLVFGQGPAFLGRNADAPLPTIPVLSMAAAGAINGAIYWCLLRRFSRPRPLPPKRS